MIPKFAYKVDYLGTELLCPHSYKWIPFSKEKTRAMLLARDNNLGGLKKAEMEENQEMGEKWALSTIEDLKEKAELQFS